MRGYQPIAGVPHASVIRYWCICPCFWCGASGSARGTEAGMRSSSLLCRTPRARGASLADSEAARWPAVVCSTPRLYPRSWFRRHAFLWLSTHICFLVAPYLEPTAGKVGSQHGALRDCLSLRCCCVDPEGTPASLRPPSALFSVPLCAVWSGDTGPLLWCACVLRGGPVDVPSSH